MASVRLAWSGTLRVTRSRNSEACQARTKKRDFARQADLVNGIAYSSGLGGRTESCFSVLDSEQQGLSGDGLKDILDLIIWPAQPREYEKKKSEFEGFGFLLHPDLVNAINYSSGLGGCTQSCLSVLDPEQQGLSGDVLKDILDLIIWPAQPREEGKKRSLPGKLKNK